MKKFTTLAFIAFVSQLCFSQLHTSLSTEIYVSASDTLYSNESIANNGTITLKDQSILVFDNNLVNDGTITYQNSATEKGKLQIGSGKTTSGVAQDIKFSSSATEEAPYITLNKTGGTATITRGHMRLLEQFKSVSGTLDANSTIVNPNVSSGLTFTSSSTKTAVVEESTGGSVENVIIERYMTAKRAFRFFSSSVTTTGSIKANLQEGGQITTAGAPASDPRPGYGTHITGSVATDGFDITSTGNPSMFTWNASGQSWSPISNTATKTLVAGESSLLFVRGDRSIDLSSNTQVGNATTLRTLGDLHVGNFTAPNMASGSGEYSHVGNPYQAQVDLELLLANTTGINKTSVWIFDPTNAGGFGAYVLLTFNASTGDFESAVPVSNTNPTAINQFLQPNQSFFVVSDAASPTLTFEETQKKASDQSLTTTVFSNENEVAEMKVSVNLYETSDQDLRDGIQVRFSDNYSDTYDAYEDAYTFWNSLETMATSLDDGSYLTLDKRSLEASTEVVQLFINNFTATNYNFQMDINNPENHDIYLVDNYLNTQTLLDDNYLQHDFSVDASIPESISPTRFQLNINPTTMGNEEFDISNISVYPNPVKDIVNVSLSQFSGTVQQLSIYDITGKMVSQQDVSGNSSLEINMQNYASGIYILQIDTDSGQFQKKLIKE